LTHFKKPKVFEIIGKGGKDSNPIPPRDAGISTADTGRVVGGDTMLGRFEDRARVAVELHLPVAIEARSLSFERLRFRICERESFAARERERFERDRCGQGRRRRVNHFNQKVA